MTAGYVQLMRGFYSFVFGSAGQEFSLGWSLFRILFGVVVTVGMVLVLLLAMDSGPPGCVDDTNVS